MYEVSPLTFKFLFYYINTLKYVNVFCISYKSLKYLRSEAYCNHRKMQHELLHKKVCSYVYKYLTWASLCLIVYRIFH